MVKMLYMAATFFSPYAFDNFSEVLTFVFSLAVTFMLPIHQ